MHSDGTVGFAVFAGFVTGICFAFMTVYSCATPTRTWQAEAIKHGAAQYNVITGKFEWKEEGCQK